MISMQFLTAGKATFTVDNGKGTHYTFKIAEKIFLNSMNTQRYLFVRMLTEAKKYTYLGTFQYGVCKVTKKSKLKSDSKPVQVFNWAVEQISSQANLPNGYSIKHSGKCGKCQRKLTTPKSLATGLGPVCGNRQ